MNLRKHGGYIYERNVAAEKDVSECVATASLSFGSTGIIELLPCGDRVKKSPWPHASSYYDKIFQRTQLKLPPPKLPQSPTRRQHD